VSPRRLRETLDVIPPSISPWSKVPDTHGLPVIPTGDATTLRVGHPVVALGAPLGLFGTVNSGIVGALGRDVPEPSDNGTTATLPAPSRPRPRSTTATPAALSSTAAPGSVETLGSARTSVRPRSCCKLK